MRIKWGRVAFVAMYLSGYFYALFSVYGAARG